MTGTAVVAVFQVAVIPAKAGMKERGRRNSTLEALFGAIEKGEEETVWQQ